MAMDLSELAQFSLDFGVKQLREGNALRVMALIFTEEGMHFLTDDGSLQDEVFMAAVREKVKELSAQAVCLLGDSFQTVIESPEGLHRISHGERVSPQEIIARKWGRKREAIFCTVERPGERLVFSQFYRRNAANAVITEERGLVPEGFAHHKEFGNTEPFYFFERPAPTVQ